jgi:pilus assembly protein Flp/PilA
MHTLKRFFIEQSGAVSLEYAMLGAMLSIMIIAGAGNIGSTVKTMFLGPVSSALGGGGSSSTATSPTPQ